MQVRRIYRFRSSLMERERRYSEGGSSHDGPASVKEYRRPSEEDPPETNLGNRKRKRRSPSDNDQ